MNFGKVHTIIVVALVIAVAAGCEKQIPRLRVDAREYDKTAAAIPVQFSAALKRTEQSQYWITIVPAGAPDYEWGIWQAVPNNAGRADISLPKNMKPGKYEVRLHADFPARPYHVIDRKSVVIR